MSIVKYIAKGEKTTPILRFTDFPVINLPTLVPKEACSLSLWKENADWFLHLNVDFSKCAIPDLSNHNLRLVCDCYNSGAKQTVDVVITSMTDGLYKIQLTYDADYSTFVGIIWVQNKLAVNVGAPVRSRFLGIDLWNLLYNWFLQIYSGSGNGPVAGGKTGCILDLWELFKSKVSDDQQTFAGKIQLTAFDLSLNELGNLYINQYGQAGAFDAVKNQLYYLRFSYDGEIKAIFAFRSNADYAGYACSQQFCNWILQTRNFPPGMNYPDIHWDVLYWYSTYKDAPEWMKGYAEIFEQRYQQNIFDPASPHYLYGAHLAQVLHL